MIPVFVALLPHTSSPQHTYMPLWYDDVYGEVRREYARKSNCIFNYSQEHAGLPLRNVYIIGNAWYSIRLYAFSLSSLSTPLRCVLLVPLETPFISLTSPFLCFVSVFPHHVISTATSLLSYLSSLTLELQLSYLLVWSLPQKKFSKMQSVLTTYDSGVVVNAGALLIIICCG